MYAVTQTSFRAIRYPSDAVPGENVVDEAPQSLVDTITAIEAAKDSNALALRGMAEGSLADIRAFLSLPAPTNAQTLVVVKLLCRVCIGLIRLQLRKLDGLD